MTAATALYNAAFYLKDRKTPPDLEAIRLLKDLGKKVDSENGGG